MKFSLKAFVLSLFAAIPTGIADPVPANLKVFCFRFTDIREDCNIKNRFHFEFEVLNWSDAYAGGIQVSFAYQSDSALTFAAETTFNGIDQNGRPLIPEDTNDDGVINSNDLEDTFIVNGELDFGEDKNNNERLDNDPAPGNLPTNNNWIRSSVTDSTIIWGMGEDDPVSFINLLDTSPNNLACMPDGTVDPNTGTIFPVEAIDNGRNVKDGFVMVRFSY